MPRAKVQRGAVAPSKVSPEHRIKEGEIVLIEVLSNFPPREPVVFGSLPSNEHGMDRDRDKDAVGGVHERWNGGVYVDQKKRHW